jgi:hypothetical protein
VSGGALSLPGVGIENYVSTLVSDGDGMLEWSLCS